MKKYTHLKQNGIDKIIQISDTHLFASDDFDIFGVKSNLKFKEIIHKIGEEDISDADAIVLTGDLSQDETYLSYQRLIQYFNNINLPVYWIPGNHDNVDHMKRVFNENKNFFYVRRLSLQNWDLIFLNSKIDGSDDGYLTKEELESLKTEIIQSKKTNIAVVMHHHPIEIDTPLIDKYILRNKEEFWNIVTDSSVKLVICGHVHGDYRFVHNNIALEMSPSTCIQWKKGASELNFDFKIGYKTFYFNENDYKAFSKIW
jgi:Icc protein